MTFTPSAVRRAAFRFFVYGALLVAGEVAFYTVVKVGRLLPAPVDALFQFVWLVDPSLELGRVWTVPLRSLYGQASLWMFLVYGSIAPFGLPGTLMISAAPRVAAWARESAASGVFSSDRSRMTGTVRPWSTSRSASASSASARSGLPSTRASVAGTRP